MEKQNHSNDGIEENRLPKTEPAENAPHESRNFNGRSTEYDRSSIDSGEAFATSFESDSFYSYEREKTAQDDAKESKIINLKAHRIDVLSWVLFALSILAIPLGFLLLVSTVAFDIFESKPVVFLILLAALPISSFIYGIILATKGKKSSKNIIIALISLLFVGNISLTVLTPDVDLDFDYQNAEEAKEFIGKYENILGIDVPEGNNYYYYDYYDKTSTSYAATVEFDLEAEKDALVNLGSDERFVKRFPTTYAGMLPEGYKDQYHTAAMIYNASTGSYNEMPEEDGKYSMIYVAITLYDDTDYATVEIVEYTLNYTSTFG